MVQIGGGRARLPLGPVGDSSLVGGGRGPAPLRLLLLLCGWGVYDAPAGDDSWLPRGAECRNSWLRADVLAGDPDICGARVSCSKDTCCEQFDRGENLLLVDVEGGDVLIWADSILTILLAEAQPASCWEAGSLESMLEDSLARSFLFSD